MKNFRNFIARSFKSSTAPLQNTKYHEYVTLNPKLYRQIQVDVNRGLWRFRSLFQLEQQEMCQMLQRIFLRYFILVWMNLPPESQDNYFQGVSDLFEVVFASFMDVSKIQLILSALQFNVNAEIDFELVFAQPNRVFNYSVQLGTLMHEKTQFGYAYYVKIAQQVVKDLKQYDPLLYSIMGQVPEQVQEGMLLKSTVNCGLHMTDLCGLSTILAWCTIEGDQAVQAFIIQNLISVSARVYAPHYFDSDERDQLYKIKGKLILPKVAEPKNDYFEIAMEILNDALNIVLSSEDNEESLMKYITDLMKNEKTYKKRKIEDY
ncbi:Conserved_hypothetical protein [Hexamita inflata]|uniref:Uncharacterized protein n=1 Tax=Hexamita inflata TaxID=28002 RepID=A0AA86QAR2_9EUKA|nr:Conserved hypothetical protein [Hexamita inflata]